MISLLKQWQLYNIPGVGICEGTLEKESVSASDYNFLQKKTVLFKKNNISENCFYLRWTQQTHFTTWVHPEYKWGNSNFCNPKVNKCLNWTLLASYTPYDRKRNDWNYLLIGSSYDANPNMEVVKKLEPSYVTPGRKYWSVLLFDSIVQVLMSYKV